MKIIKRWFDPESDTVLPPIIGLFSIELEEGRCVNIILTLNLMRMEYPLYDLMLNEEWYEKFLKRNIIGWIVVDHE